MLLHIYKWNAKHKADVHDGNTVFFAFSTQIFDTTLKHSCSTFNWLMLTNIWPCSKYLHAKNTKQPCTYALI